MKYKWQNYCVKTFRGFMTLIAVCFVTVAIVISLARIFTPFLNKHKEEFSHWVGVFLQRPVNIGSISATFSNFEPVFIFKNVTVFLDAKDNRYITVPNLSIGINIFDSIIKQTLITGHITVDGVKIKAELEQDGKLDIYINGQLISEKNTKTLEKNQSSNETAIWSWLLNQHRLELKNIDIQWSRYNREKLHLNKLDAILINTGDSHKLRGSAYTGAGVGSKIIVGADLTGKAQDIANIKATMYFSGENLPIGQWINSQQYKDISVKTGIADIKLWADWSNQAIQKIQTHFIVTNMQINAKASKKPFQITQLSGDILWSNAENNAWTIWADNIDFIINGHSWPTDKIGFFYDPNQNIQSLAISYLNIGDINELLTSTNFPINFLNEENKKLLTALRPQGELRNINLLYDGDAQNIKQVTMSDLKTHLYINTQFSNIGIKTYQMYPGIGPLTGNIITTPENGKININTKQNQLDYPTVFNNILSLQAFDTQITWNEQPKYWNINIDRFNVVSDLFNIDLQAGIKISKHNKAPELNALAHITENDLSRLREMIPSKILSKHLVPWLEQAFVAGKGIDATIVYRGNLQEKPFTKNRAIFIVDSQLKNLTLSYAPPWPVIKNTDINLVFRDNSMQAEANNGEILGININHIVASIPQLVDAKEPGLIINSQLSGDSNAGLQFVAHSPLQKNLSGLNLLRLTGLMKLDLKLYIPLVKNSLNQKTKGILHFNNNTLEIPSQKLVMNDISGKLIFTNTGAQAKKITGKIFNYPAIVSINTVTDKNKNSTINVNINGHVEQKDLIKQFDFPLLRYLRGASDYNALLKIPHNSDVSLTVTSNLKGMQVQLPLPYNKPADASTPLIISAVFTKEDKTKLHIGYNKLLSAALTLVTKDNQISLWSGKIILGFGYGIAKSQDHPGLVITGYLPIFNWKMWQPYFETMQNKNKSNTSTSKASLLKSITLKIGELDAFDLKLKSVNISLMPQVQAWQFKINSKTIVGNILYPDENENSYIVGSFKKLHLAAMSGKNEKFDPSTIPRLNITIDDFLYGKMRLNGVHFKVTPFKNNLEKGITVEQLDLQSDELKLVSKGNWVVHNNNTQATHITGNMTISDLGTVLQKWDVTDKFKSGSGTANFDLKWKNSPMNFKLKNSTGILAFNLTNGRITGLDKGTESKIGLGKVINALSINSLLHLDDIGKGGYSYTSFVANMNIGNGRIHTNSAQFQGPVADLGIKGTINLAKEKYNLILQIKPHLTSSLPILAGVLVNPVVGALAWVADKVIVSPGVDAIAAINYTVTGPFGDPVITKMNSDNNGQPNSQNTKGSK